MHYKCCDAAAGGDLDSDDAVNDMVAAAAARCQQLCRSPWQLGAGLVVPYTRRLPHALCDTRHKHQQEISQLLSPDHRTGNRVQRDLPVTAF